MAPSSSIGVAARNAALKYRCIHGTTRTVRLYSSRPTIRPGSTSPVRSSQPFSQQSRSISLFGWGASSQTPSPSQPATPDLTITQPPPSSSSPTILESARTFKAPHGTADLPASSLDAHKPTDFEPQSIENLQQAIASPFTPDESPVKDLSQLPERLGYLKEDCGLDFGWGFSTTMEWVFEHIHIVGGLSWTASIIVLAVAFRCSILPLSITSARQAAKMREVKPLLDPIKEKYNEAKAQNDLQKMQKYQAEVRFISKEYDVNLFKAFLPPLVQLPFGFGAWRVLRNAGTLPVPGFVTENWLWTSDLSFSDPYFITPALSAAIVYATMKLNFKNNAGVANSNFQQLLVKVLPAISFLFISFQPGAVQVYFLASSCAGYFTTYMMNLTAFRRLVNLPPLAHAQQYATAKLRPLLAARSKLAAQQSSVSSTPVLPSQTVGHMRRRHDLDSIPKPAPDTATQADPNRSWIDKSLDSAKASWQSSISTPINNIKNESFKTYGKQKTNEKTVFEREKREARDRLRQEEWRRERNEEERRRAAGK